MATETAPVPAPDTGAEQSAPSHVIDLERLELGHVGRQPRNGQARTSGARPATNGATVSRPDATAVSAEEVDRLLAGFVEVPAPAPPQPQVERPRLAELALLVAATGVPVGTTTAVLALPLPDPVRVVLLVVAWSLLAAAGRWVVERT